MKNLRPSSQYKKDLKRIRNDSKKIEVLLKILSMLENEIPIPPKYKPHKLSNDYAGCFECHIQSDYLLIWIDEETNDIDLVRIGSHSELFGNGAKR